MSSDPAREPSSPPDRPPARRPLWTAAAMTALIGAFFLVREHWGHLAGYWTYLLLLACPLLHLFHGHGTHGHHAGHGRPANPPVTKDE